MTQFLAAFSLFVALHSVPAIPPIRSALISRLGHGPYIAVYSLASLVALVWLFHATLALDYVELWEPAAWQGWVTLVAGPLGLFFVLAGLLSRNPFSTTARRGDDVSGAIVSITRHPVLWGFLIWALGHIPPNGDLRSLLLFGGFSIFTAGSVLMMEKRARWKLGKAWATRTAGTSITPFLAILQGRTRFRIDAMMALALLLAVLAVAWLLSGGHAWLFGADPLAWAGL